MINQTSTLIVHTSWGRIHVTANAGRIIACDLPVTNNPPSAGVFIKKIERKTVQSADRSVFVAAEKFIRSLFSGKSARPPKVTIPEGTELQRTVWKKLYGMKWGEVISYGGLAAAVGRPRAARAIGQACGANPIPLFIPCHRVLGAHGALGGFSSGLAWKKILLEKEAIDLVTDGSLN
jgi:O-6-methylguanine DNA methyltransferase